MAILLVIAGCSKKDEAQVQLDPLERTTEQDTANRSEQKLRELGLIKRIAKVQLGLSPKWEAWVNCYSPGGYLAKRRPGLGWCTSPNVDCPSSYC
jgi:hypothetical protein